MKRRRPLVSMRRRKSDPVSLRTLSTTIAFDSSMSCHASLCSQAAKRLPLLFGRNRT